MNNQNRIVDHHADENDKSQHAQHIKSLGGNELVYDIGFLQQLAGKHSDIWVCANLRFINEKKPVFATHKTLNRGGKQILVSAIVDPKFKLFHNIDVEIIDPVKVLKKIQKTVLLIGVNNIQLKRLEEIVFTNDPFSLFIVENTFSVLGSTFSKRKIY